MNFVAVCFLDVDLSDRKLHIIWSNVLVTNCW